MKNLSKVYLTIALSSLVTGCGGNRGGSNSLPSTEVKQSERTKPMSELIVQPKNKLAKMNEWTSESGQKFILLGSFEEEEFPNFNPSKTPEFEEVGTLSFTKALSTYQPEYHSGEPTPTSRHTSQDTEFKVYLIGNSTPGGQQMLGVKPGVVSAVLADESNLVSVGSAFKYQCYSLHVPAAPRHIYTAIVPGLPDYDTGCNQQNICDMRKFEESNIALSFDDAVLTLGASCNSGAMIPSHIYSLPNTSHLESFQIKMTGEAAKIAKEVDFANAI